MTMKKPLTSADYYNVQKEKKVLVEQNEKLEKQVEEMQVQVVEAEKKAEKADDETLRLQLKLNSFGKEKVAIITLSETADPVVDLDGFWSKKDYASMQKPFLRAIRVQKLKPTIPEPQIGDIEV